MQDHDPAAFVQLFRFGRNIELNGVFGQGFQQGQR
jgi:hypothetical protein